MAAKQVNYTGKKFGKFTILQDLGKRLDGIYVDKRSNNPCKHYTRFVAVVCECGHMQTMRLFYLTAGYTNGCRGCAKAKHRLSRTPEYHAWNAMIHRCTNEKYNNYKYYGGRGIKVCKKWNNSFENFLADMGKRPSSKHSLDRINNDGNYEPSNCRWATKKQQMSNQQRTSKKTNK